MIRQRTRLGIIMVRFLNSNNVLVICKSQDKVERVETKRGKVLKKHGEATGGDAHETIT